MTANTTVLFLDLDGVLVSEHEHRAAEPVGGSGPYDWLYQKKRVEWADRTHFNAIALASVRNILDACPDARIVVHSDWTVTVGPAVTMQALLKNGFGTNDFHSDWCLETSIIRIGCDSIWHKFNCDHDFRGCRPAMWLSLHPEIQHYAVLDDKPVGTRAVTRPSAIGNPLEQRRRPWIMADGRTKQDPLWVPVRAAAGGKYLRPEHVIPAVNALRAVPVPPPLWSRE